MLQYSTYSVISPEGCASILWKSAERASDAAEAMGITSARLKELDLIDQIIEEPLGAAHRDIDATAQNLKQSLADNLASLDGHSVDELVEMRYQHLMKYGHFKG
jgi:acetyl-CoA carboxylase carboxyl transferase subunit alpha